MQFDPTVKLGDFLTAGSVLIAAITFIFSSVRDRRLRRKEYADRIRQAAASTAIAIDRWIELAGGFYDNLQPVITDTDSLLVKNDEEIKQPRHLGIWVTRDSFWRALVELRASTKQRILDAGLDSAYKDLYGYTPEVQQLYTSTMSDLKHADEDAYLELLMSTQQIILHMEESKRPLANSDLGNRLRERVGAVRETFEAESHHIAVSLRRAMVSLINASDGEIFGKKFKGLYVSPEPVKVVLTNPDQIEASKEHLNELARCYDDIRARETSRNQRVQPLAHIVSRMLEVIPSAGNIDVVSYLSSASAGQRLMATCYLYARPDPKYLQDLISAFESEKQGFLRYWEAEAMDSLINQGAQLTPEQRRQVEEVRKRVDEREG